MKRDSLTFEPLMHKDLLTLAQSSRSEIEQLFTTAAALKAAPQHFLHALEGKVIVLLFEKDSLRTLVSFEAGMAKLGGRAIYLDHRTNRIGTREPIRDYARNLERWTDAIVARTYSHTTIEELAQHASIPVINALSDLYHPCQALADYFTLFERFGSLKGLRVAYMGDGNNVCHSLMMGAAHLGATMTVITPPQYEPAAEVIATAQNIAKVSGASIATTNDPAAAANHQAVYTDTWVSMGQEHEADQRAKTFAKYQVTRDVMKAAGAHAVFMHCLPAHRGQEVTAEVIDSHASVIYDQAENRMHAQNALLLHLLGSSSTHTVGGSRAKRAVAAL
jgi:ornithine carbamoyltransferase